MKPSFLKLAAVALVTAPLLFLAPSCTPECVDQFDCAKEDGSGPFTCEQGVCKPGSPTPPAPDGGETGGGGGETGGGGGATGGGGGTTGGGGGTDDGGTGGGGNDDGGTGGGGGDDAGTGGGGGGGATGGGGGTTPVDPTGAYVATLSGAQVVPPNATTDTGAGTLTLASAGDGGYTLQWNVTHTFGNGGTRAGGIDRGIGGLAPLALVQDFPNIASPITGTRALSPAEAQEMAEGHFSVRVTRSGATIRGQIVRQGHSLWTAQLNTATTSATLGGAQLIAPPDGGAVTYLGAWTNDVAATLSHIHQGGAGGTGAALITLALTADAGGLSGSFPVADLSQSGNTDGGLYVNVHTADAGNGLIRGQLVKH